MKTILLATFAMMLTSMFVHAQTSEEMPYPDYEEDVFMDMDPLQNLSTPAVSTLLHDNVVRIVEADANLLLSRVGGRDKNDVKVDLLRNGEVFVATFPVRRLFAPNDTLLSTRGEELLEVILPSITDPYRYKVVIKAHADDTGSELYQRELTTARVSSMYDWFLRQIDDNRLPEEIVIIPYPMGATEPVNDNESMSKRDENRRIEVYFVPAPRLIELAGKS